jgi:hypothetical protein
MKDFALNEDDIEHFYSRGFVRVENAINESVLKAWSAEGARRVNSVENPPDTGIIELQHTKREYLHNIAPRAWYAMLQLLGGESRVKVPEIRDDWNYNSKKVSPDDWLAPEQQDRGWHIDGDYFKHFLDSPEQALLCLIIWSDVGPRSGGTFLACDSIKHVAELLMRDRTGLLPTDFTHIYGLCKDFHEVTGKAGDVILAHPFMIHAPSSNTTGSQRLLTNPPVSLLDRMNFNREDGQYSVLEQSILNVLGLDQIDYVREGEDEHFRAWRKDREVVDLYLNKTQ